MEKEKVEDIKTKKKQSLGCQRIERQLEVLGVLYHKEIRLAQCKDIKALPFDFMVIVDGKVGFIEYDGEQHFEQSTMYQKTLEAFEKQQNHDITKNRFTREHKISLLRIAYDVDLVERHIITFIDAMKRANGRVDMFSSPLLYIDPYNDKKDIKTCLVM
jgi:hypothetical protein